jgi:hypothetical protein
MSLDLHTVQGFVKGVRGLLLDKVQPYRYSDDAILAALNLALLDGRRLRADLFVCRYGNEVPEFNQVSGDVVPIEPQFRLAFEYGIAAHVLLRDEEDVQDARANAFRDMFESGLLGVRQAPLQGGTPNPQQAAKG